MKDKEINNLIDSYGDNQDLLKSVLKEGRERIHEGFLDGLSRHESDPKWYAEHMACGGGPFTGSTDKIYKKAYLDGSFYLEDHQREKNNHRDRMSLDYDKQYKNSTGRYPKITDMKERFLEEMSDYQSGFIHGMTRKIENPQLAYEERKYYINQQSSDTYKIAFMAGHDYTPTGTVVPKEERQSISSYYNELGNEDKKHIERQFLKHIKQHKLQYSSARKEGNLIQKEHPRKVKNTLLDYAEQEHYSSIDGRDRANVKLTGQAHGIARTIRKEEQYRKMEIKEMISKYKPQQSKNKPQGPSIDR